MNSAPAEFVGGPIDGRRNILFGEPEDVGIKELNNGSIIEHLYVRRRINGIAVRLPNGLIPYDWVPTKAQQALAVSDAF